MKNLYKAGYQYRISLLIVLLLSMFAVKAQNVQKVEYYLDNDPGFGNGTNAPITQSQDVTAFFQVNVNNLSNGFHNLFVRSFVTPYAVTENGKSITKGGWSLTSRRTFFKETINASVANIVKGEYFVDTDPGFGNGINIPLPAGQHLSNLSFTNDITSLTAGFHNLYVRFKDAKGSWSFTSVRSFYKESLQRNSTTLPNIVQGEYFFDTDPGFGSGSAISITPGTNLQNLTFTTDVTSLQKGFHRLYVRFKDANGRWSQVNTKTFYKETFAGTQAIPEVVQLEYYIDNDPGYNNGRKVSITAGATIEKTFAVDMTDVSIGNHRIYVRAQDAKGNWSLVSTGSFKVEAPTELIITVEGIEGILCAGGNVSVPFDVNAPFGSNNIFTAQLSNASGSFSSPVNIGTLTGNNKDTIHATIPANTSAGTGYRIRIIATSPEDTSGANTTPLTINRLPEQFFSINGKTNACVGREMYAASATQSNTKYTWVLTGGGTMDTTGASATVNWTTAGTYTLKVTPSNACGSYTQRTLDVNVFEGAPTSTPTITNSGRTLYSSTGTVATGVAAYKWFKDGVEINGITSSAYFASADGSYTVQYTNPCGVGPVSAPFIVFTKKTQTVTFEPIPDFTFRDTSFVVKATASSNLPVTYLIVSGSANIKGDTIHVYGAGDITIRATQAGNDTVSSAFADDKFTVSKAVATITLSNLNHIYNGSAKTATATTSPAGQPVSFTYNGNSAAPVNAGAYEVIATINNGSYTGTAKDTLRIAKANQTITFASVRDREYGNNTFDVTASATSGLPVAISISSNPGGIASINDKTITITGIGQIFLATNQAGNNNYNAANEVLDTFQVSKGSQGINIDIISDKEFDSAPFDFNATSSTGLPLTYSIVTIPAAGVASLSGNTISLLGGSGTVTITATQAGNQFYNPAQAQRSFKVLAGAPDLLVKNVLAAETEIAPNDIVKLSWTVANIGKAASRKDWSERIYMQTPDGQNKTLIKQVVFSNTDSLPATKDLERNDSVTIPATLNIGNQGVFVVELIPAATVKEVIGGQANNIAVQQTPWTVGKKLLLEVSNTQLTEGATGIVAKATRTGSLTNPLTFNVTFTNTQRFSYPTTVTIPAGQAAVNFTVAATENSAIEGTVVDSLRISATNFQAAKVILSVIDNEKPSLQITKLTADVMEGDTVKFTISTNLAPKQPLQVLLSSSNTGRFPVPSSVTIPAGALSVEVPVKLEQDNLPEIDLAVNIIAGTANQNSASATTLVKDDDLPKLELVIQTNIISESAGFYATQATLRRASKNNPIAFTANLSASLPNNLILPPSISLAANENEKTFTVGVIDNTLAEGDRQVNITASLYVNSCGCTASSTSSGSVSTPITVTDNDGPALQITATQLTLPEGAANAGTIRVRRNTATKDALSVNLTSSNTGEATVPATVVIAAGQAYVDVPVTTVNDGVTDGNQQVYFQATSTGFSTGSLWVIVSDANRPDLQIPVVTIARDSVQAMSIFNYEVSIKNSGFAPAPTGVLVRGYLSKDDLIGEGDTLILEDVLTSPLSAGQTFKIINAVKAPNLPGQQKLLFQVNPELTLTELLATNNLSKPVNLYINPDYTATAQVNQPYYFRGNTIPITGSAKSSDGTAAVNKKVDVFVITNGLRRTITAITDNAGQYKTEFRPLAKEAGHYAVGAVFPGLPATTEQDNFDILSVRINDGKIPHFLVSLEDTLKGTFTVQNLSSRDLPNFTLVPVTLPNGAVVKFATLPLLKGNATMNLGYEVSGTTLSAGNNYEVGTIQAKADVGTMETDEIFYFCQARKGYLVADVSKLEVTVSQSIGERVIEFRIMNKGNGGTGNVTINLPDVKWLGLVSAHTLPSMNFTDSSTVILKFLATADVPFDYPVNGNIVISSENGNSFIIPFTYRRVSESKGDVLVTAVDQFTYFTEGAPKVQGAHVIIKNYFTGVVYADGVTDANGTYLAKGLPEGKHRIIVERDQHQPYVDVVTVSPGDTVNTTVFLNYQAITFNWNVVPTAVQDKYDITLESKFETHVPVPVVTVEMPKIFPQLSGSETYAFNVTLTNHGLITAKNVVLTLPQDDQEYEFITNYIPADLLAEQSIQVPAIMRRRTSAPAPGMAANSTVGSVSQFLGISTPSLRSANGPIDDVACTLFGIATFYYNCGGRPIDGRGAAMAEVYGRNCGDGVFNWFPDVFCVTCGDNGTSTAPPVATGNTNNTKPLVEIRPVVYTNERTNCAIPVPDLFSGSTTSAKSKTSAKTHSAKEASTTATTETANAVCASVKVQFSQQLTMTREAFEGTLEIFNGHPSEAMDSLSVEIQITDPAGVPSNDLFEIQTKSLINLSDVTGSGNIASQQKGSVKFLFIPEVGAAPTASKVYKFGGVVRYWDPYVKKMVTMPLSAVPLTVNPSPNLMLHYFMERNILGDDALTSPDIEPSVPAELAVMVENQGYGPAVNMTISSAQPKIVENEKGLAINFSLIGSNFQGQPKKLGVTDINFGTIPGLQTRIGQWYFTSSLLGKFVSYDAKVVHANSFGNPDLSLVKGVKLHELTKSIREYGVKGDAINDFLVNDNFDTHNEPDIIYFSQGHRIATVYPATSGSFSSPVVPPTFTNKLTVTASDTGWNYIQLNDPGSKLYEIKSVTRNDGQVIPLDNAWLTFVTLPLSHTPVYENKFHFVDTFSSKEPVTYTIVWKPKNLDVPKVDSISGAPKEITSTQVQNLKVKFNKRIDPATFTHEDLTLTLQGGQNIINSSVVVTQIDTATFTVDLSKVTTGNGFYAFTVQAANVADIYGINGTVGKQVTWTQFQDVPTVQEFKAIPVSKVASSYDTIQVLFNLPIDEATVTPERFKIMKDGVTEPGRLTIDSVRADHKLFHLSGLKDILTQNGAYEIVVDLPNIKSVNQASGVQTQSVTLTVDNAGPIVLSIEKSNTGGIDAAHVPFVNIKFNEEVVDFNTASIKLTRNGEVIPLNIDQLLNTDLKSWSVGNFGMLTYPDGDYSLTVDLTGLKDKIGNSGTGTRQVSWIVNRSAIVNITNLTITPDLGHSNTDGITSDPSFSVKFNLGSDATQVTLSQVDPGGETGLAIAADVAAGNVSIPVSLGAGGNIGIKVTATGVNGGVGTAEKILFVDQTPLSAKWLLSANMSVTRQPDTVQLLMSDKLLTNQGFLNAIQLGRNGTSLPTSGLTFTALNDTLYEVQGLRSASTLPGEYQLAINLQRFVKHTSGKSASGPVITAWTVESTNRAPIAKAGDDITITRTGNVTLNGSTSVDPDSDPITYRWVAPAGIELNDSTVAKPTFNITQANNGNTYSFLLIVNDGSSFTTDVVNVTVNIAVNQEYYRSIITGNWNNPATWQSSADSINWTAATISPNFNSRHITIQNGHTVTVTESITIDETTVEAGGVLSVASGAILTIVNNGLTLRSNATGSGSIGTSAGTIAGDVTVERYIPGRRAWRMLTAPFSTVQNIKTAWQEEGSYIPGYGTHITGGTIANGFDQSPANAPSMKWFDQSLNIWQAISSTLTPITEQPAYMLFVRGDRSIDLTKGSAASANNTILRATGTLKTGTQPAVAVPATGFTLIGNPYASSINFNNISKTNVADRFYLWDPKRATVGAYVLFDGADDYEPLNPAGSYTGSNTIIESGQAFFVQGSGAVGSVGIAENSKSNEHRNAFRTTAADDGKLQVNLHSVNTDNSTTLLDATITRYSNLYTAAVTSEDAGKLDNIEENISVVRDNKLLTIERRPLITNADTMFLKIYNMKAKKYQFEITPANLDGAVSAAFLEDAWLHTRTAINLTQSTTVQFDITAEAASVDPGRFRIVFKASGALPVNITKVKAFQKDAGIQVDWSVATETNISYYEVEKSANGQDFSKVGKVAATSNNGSAASYNWFDAHPIEGNNYYRIIAIENSGNVKLSQVVVVKIGNGKNSIVVYPNPVIDRTMKLQFNNQQKGEYMLQLFNAAGQQLLNKTMVHYGGSATQTISLGSIVSKGVYQLFITNGESKITQQLIVQ